jgi:hypothetical protein
MRLERDHALHQCILAICSFPRLYRSGGDRTPRDIYLASGYATHHYAITQEAIETAVREDPALVADWVHYTQDKRWTPAGGLIGRVGGVWEVFYFDGGWMYSLTSTSAAASCALAIRIEMEQLRRLNPTSE